MATYAVTFARSARKELERLREPLRTRVLDRIERLGVEPRPYGSRKLAGGEDLWRIRVGDYRVVYSIDDSGHQRRPTPFGRIPLTRQGTL